jgi:hypothetical protein
MQKIAMVFIAIVLGQSSNINAQTIARNVIASAGGTLTSVAG